MWPRRGFRNDWREQALHMNEAGSSLGKKKKGFYVAYDYIHVAPSVSNIFVVLYK